MNKICVFTLFLCTVLFYGCSNYMEEEVNQNLCSERMSVDELYTRASVYQELQSLVALGYDVSNPIVDFDFYILEGEFKINRNFIHLLSEKQSLNSNVILHPHYRKIGITFEGGTPTDAISKVADAVHKWNVIDSDVQFAIVDDIQGSIDFPVVVMWDFNDYSAYEGNSCDLVITGARYKADAPISTISINTGHSLWSYLTSNGKEENCFLHALARIAGFAKLESFNGQVCSIFHDPQFYEHDNFFLFGIPATDSNYITSVYFRVDGEQYSYYWTPSPMALEANIIFPHTDYVLSLVNEINCCENTTMKGIISVYDKEGRDVTTDVVDDVSMDRGNFMMNFSTPGSYAIRIALYDDYIGMHIPIHTVECVVDVRSEYGYFATESDVVHLHQPYDVTYHYWNPSHPNAVVEYTIDELFFDNIGQMQPASLSFSNDMVTATIHQNGCYYVTAVVKEDNIPIDTAYCNITKMVRLPDTENSIVITKKSEMEVDPLSVDFGFRDEPIVVATYIAEEYNYDIEFRNIVSIGRFGCLVESEYENRNNFVLDNSIIRRIDRKWFMRLHKLCPMNILNIEKHDLPKLYLLYNTEPNEFGFVRWRNEYYTGYVYCPLDGIREVGDMRLHNLPMQAVEATCVGFSKQRVGFDYEE